MTFAEKKALYLKLGGASFLISDIRLLTKDEFIDKYLLTAKGFHSAPEQYLSDVWDLAHRDSDFKTAENSNDCVSVIDSAANPDSDSPTVVKQATKRKSNAKKE